MADLKRVLLIWELVPEDTEAYVLDGLSHGEFVRLCACHMRYVNADTETADVVRLSEFLEGRDLVKVRMVEGEPLRYSEPFDAIVVSGFLL